MSFLCHPQISAKLCHAAYFTDEQSVDGLVYAIDPEFGEVHLIEKDNAACIVAVHPRYIVVAFRGTNEINDWEDNLDTRHYGDWHEGFYKHYTKISQEWKRVVYAHSSRPVYFTGHSLGGAVAFISACHFGYTSGCITFGAPRALWRKSPIKKHINFPVSRITRAADVVPHVPSYLQGFRHYGEWLFIDHKGNQYDKPSLFRRFNSAMRQVFFKHEADPHHITKYMKDLEVTNVQ